MIEAEHTSTVKAPEQYLPIPNSNLTFGSTSLPVWRVHIYLKDHPHIGFGLDINGQVTLGRAGQGPDFFNMTPFGAPQKGVSRQHAQLRPTVQNLYVIDMDSLNGTVVNDKRVSMHSPTSLSDGDVLRLGHLELVVRIITRPTGFTKGLRQRASLAEALAGMAKVIVSQRNPDEVVEQALGSVEELTEAGETALWIVDENTGDLHLKAHRGMGDKAETNRRLTIDTTLAGKVVSTGKPFRANAQGEASKVKISTGYLVESVMYIPLKLGDVTIGVLGAVHQAEGQLFSDRDETILIALGDLAAVAIQNARLYQATDEALARRVEELAAINELTALVTQSLDLQKVYMVLKQKLLELWPVETSELWLADEDMTQFVALSQLVDGITPVWYRQGDKSIANQVITTGEPYFTNNTADDPHFREQIDGTVGFNVRSILCVPLTSHGTTVGALALFNRQQAEFSELDVDRLKTFAVPAAAAVRNARLFRQSERERAIIRNLINRFPGPLIILDEMSDFQIVNEAAQNLIDTQLADVMMGISSLREDERGELEIGEAVYLATAQYTPALGTLVIMQDITYRKQLEVAREEFVHGLSHDLKSPLSSISGYGQLLQDGDLGTVEMSFAANIVRASDRMLIMINHLLDVARLTGDVTRKRLPFDLLAVSAEAVDDLNGAALMKRIEVETSIRGEPYEIMGDRVYFHRSLLNLIDNAIKYSPEDSRILLAVNFQPDQVTIVVRDDGPGIPEDDLPHIFERYFRGKQDGSKATGIGLGLELVRTTIEAHDGTIVASNAAGHGAQFTVVLPGSVRAN